MTEKPPPTEVVTPGQLAHGYLSASDVAAGQGNAGTATLRAIQGIGYALLDLAAATWAVAGPPPDATESAEDCPHPEDMRRSVPLRVDGRATYGVVCTRCGQTLSGIGVVQ